MEQTRAYEMVVQKEFSKVDLMVLNLEILKEFETVAASEVNMVGKSDVLTVVSLVYD